MGPAAPIAAIAAVGFQAVGSIMKGKGESEALNFQAAKDQRAAELGRVKADQTDAQLRDELATTLANIDVTRAAAGTDPNAPTALAIKAEETRIGDRQRTNAVYSLRAQADEDTRSAQFRRGAAKSALLGGYLSAAGQLAKGAAGMGKA